MDGVSAFFLVLGILCIAGVIISVAVISSKKKKSYLAADTVHAQNMSYLQQIGFKIEKEYSRKELTFHLYFDYTRKLGAVEYYYTYTDTSSQKKKCEPITVFPLDKIIQCQLIQDGTTVHTNAVAPAMIGAAFLGLGGAIAGATAMSNDAVVGVLAVRLLIEDMKMPSVMISVLRTSTNKASQEYQNLFFLAQEVYGIFEGIVRVNEQARRQAQAQATTAGAGTSDVMDQLSKLADLKAKGVLTDQEFEAKKAMLLAKIK